MLRKKAIWYFLLCIVVSILPVSCDVQKRVYMPGYFVQKKTALPDRYIASKNYIPKHVPISNAFDSGIITLDPHSPLAINYLHSEPVIKEVQKPFLIVPQHDYKASPKAVDNIIIPQPEKVKSGNAESNKVIVKNTEKDTVAKPVKNHEYEDLILAFLAGAGSIVLISAMRSGIKKYRTGIAEANNEIKTKQEIANIADRLDRCADRYANANNERIELAARNMAVEINKCNTVDAAKKLERSFSDSHLTPAQTADEEYITLNNLLSNDLGYGGGTITLKPDVVATDGGFYKNSAGSVSWTMGEPITETFTDGKNTLTQGFQQGSYLTVSVSEVDQPGIDISVYPNPFVSTLNIKCDSTDPFNVQAVDMQGNVISTQSFTNGVGQVDFSNLPEAMYLLRVTNKDGVQLKVFKIQKVD